MSTGADRMHTITKALPAVDRTDATVITFSEWRVAEPARQHATMHAAIDAWEQFPWPDGVLSHTCLSAEDQTTLRHLAIWSDAAAVERTTAASAPRFESIQSAAGTSIERVGIATHHPPRSFYAATERADAGCVVIIDITLEEPDDAVQRRWIDAVLEALEHRAPDGLLTAHLHPSTDGTKIVNYATWTSARAHRDALAGNAEHSLRDGDARWDRVRNHPGIAASNRVSRHQHHRTAEAPA